jgi:hypothetical protein
MVISCQLSKKNNFRPRRLRDWMHIRIGHTPPGLRYHINSASEFNAKHSDKECSLGCNGKCPLRAVTDGNGTNLAVCQIKLQDLIQSCKQRAVEHN